MMRPLVLLVCCLACSDVFAPPSTAEPFDPPQIYRAWYRAMETCVGWHGQFNRITWFKVPGDGFIVFDGDKTYTAHGLWKPGHRIYLAETQLLWDILVQHEMLHDVWASAYGTPGQHDDPAFRACDPFHAWVTA